jgi:ribosomal protein S18 acetylase RimI-like enzyme
MAHRPNSPVTIRSMTEGDADAVRQVERAAFAARWKPEQNAHAERPPRTRANVLIRLRKDPDGCFVAQVGSEMVGIVFSRTWGSVGWCGSLAVHPDWQGQGIGRQLLHASLAYLRADPRRVVGLETGAGEAGNVSLYLRAGLVPCPITLHLARELGGDAEPATLPLWSAARAEVRSQWLEGLREASGTVIPGLDYGKEIESARREALGDTCVALEGGRAVGLGVATVVSPFEGWGAEAAIVQALLLDQRYVSEARLSGLLAGVEAIARRAGCRRLQLVVSAGRRWTVDRLLRRGYRLERVGLQMIHGDGPALTFDPDGVDCSRWAG